jgi:DHA1 family bicyclomycin/chloramphenicol resistance-like MFS transporter
MTSPQVRRSWALAGLLASLAMLGPFSIDMYLPAFPAITLEFGASQLAVQQTLSVYLFAYAAMMLWHGALSDAFGRRPIILGSLVVYGVGTLACAIAGNIESLWLSRALQGMSAGAGVVVGRAVIRDRFHGPEAQRLMSQITLVFGIAPAVAPIVGGALLNTLGWRWIFWALLVWVLGTVVTTARSLPETLPPQARQPLHPRALWRNYRAVLTHGDFLLLALIPAFNFAAFFMYVAVAPAFLIDQLGISTWGFAVLFLPLIAGVLVGATLSGRLAGRLSSRATINLGFRFMLGAAAANLAISAFLPPHPAWNIAPLFFFTIGSSIVMPSVTLLLLDLFPNLRGLASSLQGFIQFALAGFNSGTIAPLLDATLLRMALGMAAFTLASTALWWLYQRKAAPAATLVKGYE